ncbi:hypothetical protein PJP10_32190, partial [Mycobacterium kansasii]
RLVFEFFPKKCRKFSRCVLKVGGKTKGYKHLLEKKSRENVLAAKNFVAKKLGDTFSRENVRR